MWQVYSFLGRYAHPLSREGADALLEVLDNIQNVHTSAWPRLEEWSTRMTLFNEDGELTENALLELLKEWSALLRADVNRSCWW